MSRATPYRDQRNYENLQKAMFSGVGEYGIPELQPVTQIDVKQWIPFNFASGMRSGQENVGVHFFLDDYQFERVWRQPDVYLPMLAKFGAVCTPDFSPYADFPKAIQHYNHYRKHWCGAYWQDYGLTVIPTISWSSPDTLDWCFDGEPVGGVVATSAVGMFGNAESKEWFMRGYEAMKERLSPTMILWKGKIPDEVSEDVEAGLIVKLESFVDKWRKPVNSENTT